MVVRGSPVPMRCPLRCPRNDDRGFGVARESYSVGRVGARGLGMTLMRNVFGLCPLPASTFPTRLMSVHPEAKEPKAISEREQQAVASGL